MKKLTYSLFIFSFIIMVLSLAVFLLSHKLIQKQTFYSSVNLSDKGGFDVNGTALTFGEVHFKGGSSTRKVLLQNSYDFPIIAEVKAEGDIAPLLGFEKVILIDKGEEKEIGISVFVPENASMGF